MKKKPERKLASPPPLPKGKGGRVTAGKHRLTQIARTGSRKLFDAARRELFLEWFATTCNVKLSAEKAGICYQTVFKHRMKDETFAEAWDRALQQGYAYLEARLLQEAILPGTGRWQPQTDEGVDPSTAGSSASAPPPRSGEDLEAEAEKHFDPELAITLLREHARRLPSSTDNRKNRRTTARVATNEEVRDALVKRLKAFSMRVGKPMPGDAS